MIDMFNLSNPYLNTQVFTAATTQWQTWTKPDKAKMVYIFCLGGGGGGGGGRTAAINSSTGGGGGASSAITVALYQASLLPDTLYLQVGIGGDGGIASGVGTAGTISYISYRPDTTAINLLLQSSATTPGGGGAGGGTVGGTGGTAPTVWNYVTAVNGGLGLVTTEVGQAGTVGTSSAGTITNLTPISIVTGGAGGGGTSSAGTGYNGASILGSGFLNTISTGVINAADSTIHGGNGYNTLYINKLPNFFTGGAGGSSATTSARTAGKGGNASYGSGGGGGGGSYNGAGGAGGKGGDGLIIIACS